MPRVVYLCPFTSFGVGGIRVIAEHVTRLSEMGVDAQWWGLGSAPNWFSRHVPYRKFRTTDEIGQHMQKEKSARFVATWWQTAFWVNPNLRGGSSGFFLVQDDDPLTYSGDKSGRCYRLGLHHITESKWVESHLRSKYGADSTNVGIGIDSLTFRPLSVPRDPDRIFVPYRPSSGPNDLKGWGTALETVKIVCRKNPAASLVTFGSGGAPAVIGIPHLHEKSPSDEKMRELYSQAGVFLMPSRHEGFCLTAVEAMACGCPVVCTDANGNMEYCRHGETALVGRIPDELSSSILSIQKDSDLSMRLSAAGLRESKKYQWPPVIERLLRVLDCQQKN